MRQVRCFFALAGFLLAVCSSGCSTAPSDEQLARFNEIEAAFADAATPEEYLRVAGAYGKLYDDGVNSAAVLFNQGNAFARADRHGNAIACYRQAIRLEPGNESIQANLDSSMMATGASENPPDWFCRIVVWQNSIGYGSKFVIATIFVVLTSILAMAARRSAGPLLGRAAVISGLLACVTVSSAVYDWYRFEHQKSGTIVSQDAVPRTGNGSDYEAAFNQPLREGTEFHVEEERGKWVRIAIPGLGRGWLQRDKVVLY